MLAVDLMHQMRKSIPIRRARALAEALTVDCERVPVETLATEIQSDVQHRWASLVDDPPESLRRAGGPSSSDSFRFDFLEFRAMPPLLPRRRRR
jgi:hypothetical protein